MKAPTPSSHRDIALGRPILEKQRIPRPKPSGGRNPLPNRPSLEALYLVGWWGSLPPREAGWAGGGPPGDGASVGGSAAATRDLGSPTVLGRPRGGIVVLLGCLGDRLGRWLRFILALWEVALGSAAGGNGGGGRGLGGASHSYGRPGQHLGRAWRWCRRSWTFNRRQQRKRRRLRSSKGARSRPRWPERKDPGRVGAWDRRSVGLGVETGRLRYTFFERREGLRLELACVGPAARVLDLRERIFDSGRAACSRRLTPCASPGSMVDGLG